MGAGERLFKLENTFNVDVRIPESHAQDARAARKILEDAVKQIPDTMLRQVRNFKITVLA